MSPKNYLTTFELTSEREQKLCRNIAAGLSDMYDSTKQLYHRTPAIVRAGALVGLGIAGTLTFQKVRERAETEKKVWVSYHNRGSSDAKEVPRDYSGLVTLEQYKIIQENSDNQINHVDIGFCGW